MQNNIATEDQESETLAEWLRLMKYKFTHIANQAGQLGTKNIIKMMAKKKRMGVSKGFPDFCIILKRGSLLFIELKRSKKSLSQVSQEQKDWILQLDLIENVVAKIAYGSKQAIEIIQELEEF